MVVNQSDEHGVLQELMNENKDLQVQNENMQVQISSQVSSSTSMISVSSENIQQQTFPLIQASHVSHIEEIQKL